MARVIGTYAGDWPEPAKDAGQALEAVGRELGRLCARADALSLRAYSRRMPLYLAEWEESGKPIPPRGLSFEECEPELAEVCGEARARVEAACGGFQAGAAFAFIDRLSAQGFRDPADMEAASREALKETRSGIAAPGTIEVI